MRIGSVVVSVLVVVGCSSEPGPPCDGCILVEGLPPGAVISTVAVDREGRIVAGIDWVSHLSPVVSVARMDRFGVLDASFGDGGLVQVSPVNGLDQEIPHNLLKDSRTITAMADGSIRVGGENSLSSFPLVLGVTADGRPDGLRLAVPSSVRDCGAAASIVDQGDAMVVACGSRSRFGAAEHLVRFTSSGEPDASFPAVSPETAVAGMPDGRIIMGGGYLSPDTIRFVARRLTRDGAPDLTFGDTGAVTIQGVVTTSGDVAVAPTAAGGMILAGVAIKDKTRQLFVARFDAAGRLDPDFGPGLGFAFHDVIGTGAVADVVETVRGKIVVVGAFQARDGDLSVKAFAARLTTEGALDPTFGEFGVVKSDPEGIFWSVAALPDGDTVACGPQTFSIFATGNLFARFPAR